MSGYFVELEDATVENDNFRKVLYTGPKSQLVLMSLEAGEEIGAEVHDDHDQFIRVEAGTGKAIIDDEEFDLKDGSAIVIPAGANHNITNTSKTDKMKLYTIYAPPEHADGTVYATKAEAEAGE
ncbi:MAG: cupin domain-containing protein [bacterium]